MSLKPIHKQRREWFGGTVYSEHPGYTAFVDPRKADPRLSKNELDEWMALFNAKPDS